MYNLHTYRQEQRIQDAKKYQEQQYAKWVLRYEDLKEQAHQKQKVRLYDFMSDQQENGMVFEDDHYKQWRYNRQFRDVENQTKFLGFKAFLHKPNKELNRFFDERERKEISLNSSKAQPLVDLQRIPDELRARSLRSQGPFNPKHTFREKVEDNDYLQPRLRYTNITDKQRAVQKSVSFDDKFRSVYESFEMTKSTIGKHKIKPISKLQNIDMIESAVSDRLFQTARPNRQFHLNPEEEVVLKSKQLKEQQTDMHFNQSSTFNQTASFRHHERIRKLGEAKMSSQPKIKKTYFKLAKTQALEGCMESKELMIKSQYERKKDLTNIIGNQSCEGHIKAPVL